MSKQDGWSVFPGVETGTDSITGRSYVHNHNGMALRDFFAAQAMSGILAASPVGGKWTDLARDAYGIADALLAFREKDQ